MKPIERSAKSAFMPKTGFFSALRGLLQAQGSGAPVAALLLGLVGSLVFVSTPAQAAIAHKYISQFTGAPAGSFSGGACGVTVDPATQDVYVVDPGSNAIDIFEPSGAGAYTYKSQISGLSIPGGSFDAQYICSVAVSDVTGDVYLASEDPNAESNHHKVVYVFNHLGAYIETMNGSGTPVGSLGEGSSHESVVVDQSNGDVYDATDFQSEVNVFSSANKYLSTFSGPEWLAAISSGDIYGYESGTIYQFTPSGSLITEISVQGGGRGSGIAVDSAGDVYLTNNGVVEEFGPSGELEGQTRAAPGGSLVSAAVNSSEDLIVADDSSPGVVDILGPGIVVPGATVQAPSSVGSTTAVLDGSVNPAGVQVTSCGFEYGTSTSYGQSVPCEQTTAEIGSGTSPVKVTATLRGLQPNTTYYYHLNAADANGNADEAGVNDEVVTTPGIPKIDGESAEVKSTEKAGQTHATLTAQVTPDGRETTYHFEYGETESYGSSTPPGDLGSGEAPVPATTELSGLKVDTTYHYRVLASNECEVGKTCTAYGPDQTFTTVAAAFVEESVSGVSATSATLNAKVNPLGTDTSAYFQYGIVNCAASPTSCTDVPVPPGTDVGSAEVYQALRSIHLQSLTPDTVYYYRVVATNALGTVEGERNEKGEEVVHTFTTQLSGSAFALPDGRQWEMVSPPDKHGALIEGFSEPGLFQASADGDAFTFWTDLPTESEPLGNGTNVQVFSMRGGSSWSSQDIATPHDAATGVTIGNGFEYAFFSSDLSRALVQSQGEFTPLSPEATEQTPYVRADFTCQAMPATCYTPLVTEANVPPGTKFGEISDSTGVETSNVHFLDATPDLSHVLLTSQQARANGPIPSLIEGAPEGSLYEWAGGQLQLVNVLPESEGGAPVANASIGFARNVISNDGSRVVWSTESALYMRDMVRKETVRISGAKALFVGASSDDSKVFFKQGGETDEDLYVFEVTSGASEPLAGKVTRLTEGAAVQGMVLGASEDGSYVYFVAQGVLGDGAEHGAVPGSCKGEGMCNLYVDHYNGSAWEAPSFIAALSGEDSEDWAPLARDTSRSSPDGRYLEFMSMRSLTGYDNRDVNSGEPDEEVYLYDALTGKLVCASCNPTGAQPVGEENGSSYHGKLFDGASVWPPGRWLAANVPAWTAYEYTGNRAVYQPRYLSDSGRLFFNSHDALVPQDVNGTWDVYEYEPPGIGSCTKENATFSERSSGCVDLISSGESAQESGFLDASESGGDVFFLTASRLVPQDYDNNYDVYDARECTTESSCFPTSAEVPLPCATEASCKPAPTPQPTLYAPPASATFSGPGNLAPPPPPVSARVTKTKTMKCPKGKKLSHGKCVKAKAKRKTKAKKSAKGRK